MINYFISAIRVEFERYRVLIIIPIVAARSLPVYRWNTLMTALTRMQMLDAFNMRSVLWKLENSFNAFYLLNLIWREGSSVKHNALNKSPEITSYDCSLMRHGVRSSVKKFNVRGKKQNFAENPTLTRKH